MLNKEINLNKKFILILILINIIIIGIYYSYALFQISIVKDDIVVLKTGTIDIVTTIGYDNNEFTLSGGEEKVMQAEISIGQLQDFSIF